LRKLDRLSVTKRAAQRFNTERFNFEKLNDVAVRGQNQVKISNMSASSGNLEDNGVGINRALESIKEIMKASATESLDSMS
jgi:hypothetical protein